MRILLRVAALAAVLIGPSAWGIGLFRNYWGNVVVATDTTPEGKALTRPTPNAPVYYLGQSLGPKLGTIRGDDMPEEKAMTAIVTRILAQQGYFGARPGVHEPSLFLVVQWGYLPPRSDDLLWFLGYRAADDIGAPSNPGMLGPEVFLRDFRPPLIRTILEHASDPIYGIIVTAFEYRTANTPKPVVYWQTRIGLPANGKSMAQALPAMLMAAGPAIGQDSDKPILRDADSARTGRVDLGELKFLDVLENPPADKRPRK